MSKSRTIYSIGIILAIILAFGGVALAREGTQTTMPAPMITAFSYQGQLQYEGAPLEANCNMAFGLYDAAEGGNQVGSTIEASVPVADGIFAVQLDFGSSPFGQEARWLGIEVQCPGDSVPVALGRPALTAAPYALHAKSAPWSGVEGVPAELSDGDAVDDTVSWDEVGGLVGAGSQQVAAGNHWHDDRYFTETELQTSGLAGVHWDNLDNMPVDLSNGDDVDDTVSWSEISGLVGSNSHQVAAGDHHHDSAYYTQSQLQTSGSANLHWGNLVSVPAGFADGVDAVGERFAQVVVVAKSGGDFTSVQMAIDSITDASAERPYLVWIAPGEYSGSLTLKPHVHLQGAGQQATALRNSIRLAGQLTLRDLTVGGAGTGVGLRVEDPISNTVVANVTVLALASGAMNRAVIATGSDVQLNLINVTAEAAGASGYNYGLYQSEADITLRGCSFTARGGTHTRGILVITAGASLEAYHVKVLAENSSDETVGLYAGSGVAVTLYGGSFTGRGGTEVWGIDNRSPGLQANEVTVLAEGGTTTNYGIENQGSTSSATLRGGAFTARDGTTAAGVFNNNHATLQAIQVMAQGEDGSSQSVGFFNSSGAAAGLTGGRFVGSGGSNTAGLYCAGANSALKAQEVYALGRTGAYNYGLYNYNRCQVALVGGSFVGRGGTGAYGLGNAGNTYSTTTITAEGIWAIGEAASGSNVGLYNQDSATATLTQSVLEGSTNAIYRLSGTVTVSDSRLRGGAVSGTVSCILVTRGSTISTDGSTCP